MSSMHNLWSRLTEWVFYRWRLAHQLMFFALIVTTLLTALTGGLMIHLEGQGFRRLSVTNFEHAFKLIRMSIGESLRLEDPAVLERVVGQIAESHPYLIRLELRDGAGRRLAYWERHSRAWLPEAEWMEDHVDASDGPAPVLRVLWGFAPNEQAERQHSRRLLALLAFSLLLLTTLLIGLTRIFVVRPIRAIHDSLYSDCPPNLGHTAVALELRHLAVVARTQMLLKLESKRSERRYRGLFDNMAAGCMVLSPEGSDFRIIDINEACRRMPAMKIGNRHVEWLFEVIDIREVPELYDALHDQSASQINCNIGEFSVIRADRTFWFECHVFEIDDGEIVLMIDDITDRKQSFLLRRAKEAAEHANELKSNFMANISHEIRTPLNGVLSMVELLRGSRLSNKQRHWVDAVRSSGQLLLSTINDILDFSKIEAGRMQLENIQFSLSEVLSNLLNATAQRAYAKELELVLHQDHSLPDQLIGDPFRLQQILVNLVGNAIKFTEQGSVVIELEQREIPGDALLLCVSVTDTGIGIAPEHLQRVFMPFEQAAASRTAFSEGTGLGLAICKRLVDAMGGTIGVESKLGEGSCFHFEVPLGLVPGSAQARWLVPEYWAQCVALIRVRNQVVCESIARILHSFGFNTSKTASVEQIKAMVEQTEEPAGSYLLVLDDSLLGREGENLLSELRAEVPTASFLALYVVNMFKHGREELDQLEAQQGAAYVSKPVHASAMFNALQELFGMRSRLEKSPTRLDALPWEVLIQKMHARERLAGARILLVEDNLVNQEVTVEALSMCGIDVQIATNGEEAIRLINAGNLYDGVLMDLQMPVMDGFQATQAIRRLHGMEALPIIAMTAGVLFKDRQRCLDVGMNDHVGKPINMHKLLETLLKWVVPANPASVPAVRGSQADFGDCGNSLDYDVDWASLELPGLKVSKGLDRVGGSHKLYFKLVKSFAKAHGQTDFELASSLQTGDAETLRRLAHTLKGVATTVGADTLHALAAEVEQGVVKQPLASLKEAVDELIGELRRVLGSIRGLLDVLKDKERGAQPGVAALMDSDASRSLYIEVLELLRHCDTRLQDVCSANKDTIREWFAQRSSFYAFLEEVEQYRFEEACETFLNHTERVQA